MLDQATIAITGVLLILLSWVLNLALIAAWALPFTWLWNIAVVPLHVLPSITYGRGFGLLVLWSILQVAGGGVKLTAKLPSD